jgi:hypothetical protein
MKTLLERSADTLEQEEETTGVPRQKHPFYTAILSARLLAG